MHRVKSLNITEQLNKSYIAGKWVDGESGREYTIKDPYDNSELARVKLADSKQIKKAFESAYYAQKEWKRTTAEERKKF